MCRKSDFMHRWGAFTLAVSLRYECECAYCGRPMMQDRATTYFLGCIEHVLPRFRYPGLEKQFSNYALSCRYCNQVKLRWDPNEESGEGSLVDRSATSLSDEQHEILVARGKKYIEGQKVSLKKSLVARKI